MTLPNLVIAILVIGWPVLVIGSVIIFRSVYIFYQKIEKNSIGRLIINYAVAFIITAYCLAFIATYFLIDHPEESIIPIFIIFIIWMVVMYFALHNLSIFQTEAILLNQKYIDQNAALTAQTKQLEQQVDDLGKLNQAMVGRELKMVELKAQIAKLQSGAGHE